MTRKHFIQIAEIISRITDPTERKQLAERNAISLAKDNPLFDKARFMAACNVPFEPVKASFPAIKCYTMPLPTPKWIGPYAAGISG